MIPFEAFIRALKRVSYVETQNHVWLLHGLVGWLRPQVIVEVGCFEGACSVMMARALQETAPAGRLVCIDDFSLRAESEATFYMNVARCGVDDRIVLVKGHSSEVPWPAQVDMAFIDGDHSYDGCKADVDRAIAAGAFCVVVHDTVNWWGPRKWLDEFRAAMPEGWGVIEAYHDSGMAVLLNHGVRPPVVYDEETFGSGATDLVVDPNVIAKVMATR